MFHQEAYEKGRQRVHKTCRNSRVKGRTLGNGGGRCKGSNRGGKESSDSKRKLHCRKCNVDGTETDGTNPKTLLMESTSVSRKRWIGGRRKFIHNHKLVFQPNRDNVVQLQEPQVPSFFCFFLFQGRTEKHTCLLNTN